MLHHIIPVITLSSLVLSAIAQESTFRALGLEQPVQIEWDGNHTELKHSTRLCLDIDDASQHTEQYSLKLIDLNAEQGRFVARNDAHSIPLRISLYNPRSTETLLPGRNSSLLERAALCKNSGRNLLLQVTAYQLERAPAGTYHANIQLVANNDSYSLMADHLLRITITIPELISIHGDKEIELTGLSGLRSEAGLCVYRNGGGIYSVKIEGSSTSGQFELQKEGKRPTAPLPYSVNIKSISGTYLSASSGSTIHNLPASKTSQCNEGNNLKVQVIISDDSAKKAEAGIYQGLLKVTVAIQ